MIQSCNVVYNYSVTQLLLMKSYHQHTVISKAGFPIDNIDAQTLNDLYGRLVWRVHFIFTGILP